MNCKLARSFFPLVLLAVLYSCHNSNRGAGNEEMESDVVPLSDVTTTLFDGRTLNGWHAYNKGDSTIFNWSIMDSSLICLGVEKDGQGIDLVSNRDYDNFELSWEWKIDNGGYGGVIYHVVEDKKYNAAYQTGPEYPLADDIGFPEKLGELQKTGADNGMHPADKDKNLNPVGEWNSSRILYNKGHVEHWLNGKKIVEFEARDNDWKAKKMNSKWKSYPDYGLAKTGKIVLHDCGAKVSYRNIEIIEL